MSTNTNTPKRAAKKQVNARRILMNISIGILTVGFAIIFYAAVVYGIKKVANFSYDFSYQVFGDVAVDEAPGRDVKVTIMKGESTMNIASKLENQKLIKDKNAFYLKVKLKDSEIMPGTFVLNTSMTVNDILKVITDYDQSIEAETTVEDVESAP